MGLVIYCNCVFYDLVKIKILLGSVIIFVGLASTWVLKKKLAFNQWTGIGVLSLGILLVGASDLYSEETNVGLEHPLVGDLIIVLAQELVPFQPFNFILTLYSRFLIPSITSTRKNTFPSITSTHYWWLGQRDSLVWSASSCYRSQCISVQLKPSSSATIPQGDWWILQVGRIILNKIYFSPSCYCRRICPDEQQPQTLRHTAPQNRHHRIL